MPSRNNPVPVVTATPTVLWTLQKSSRRLTCSARRTPHGLRLEETINEGDPFIQVTGQTTEQLQALAERCRQEDVEDGWADAAD